MTAPPSSRETISFGPFALTPGERTIVRDGVPVELGGRSLDILIALTARANEVVSKRELFAQVWPDSIVEEGSLRFQIASLRKTLGDGVDGARYISTVAGRGYCFVAPVSRSGEPTQVPPSQAVAPTRLDLPGRLLRMVGRADEVRLLATQLTQDRFVTLVGSGGVGKTTLAIAVAHELVDGFDGPMIFVDLGAISDATHVATTLATMLGLSVQSVDVESALVSHLRDKRALLILDTCEHLLDTVATMASRLFAAGPQVHILATSREALRAEGERVFMLGPLRYPPDGPALTAGTVETFPAAQLFLERVRASGANLDFNDDDAAIIASICRKLDGVALAIELAAGRVQTHGLRKTAELLDERLTLSWPGKRSAPPRQRTLQAMLDWSYGLLSDDERVVLCRLAVFVGFFTFEAALQVVTCETLNESQVFRALESLIDKSLVSASPLGGMMRYRLLDTTRAYTQQIEVPSTSRAELAARHASYFRRWLEQIGAERTPYLAALGNVRAALEWSFSTEGSTTIGVELAAAAAPVFLAMSLLTECYRWSERALASLDETSRGGPEEMRLQAAFGMSLMFTRSHGDAARDALARSLDIAEQRGDAANQMLLFGPLHMFHYRRGEYRTSLQYARRSAKAATAVGDPTSIALAHCLTGIALHSMGELGAARAELEASLSHEPVSHRSRTIHLGFDYYNWAGMALGRTLWLQGHPEEAIERVRATVRNAEELDHPVTLTLVLHWAAAVYLWVGDLDEAERHIDWFMSRAETYSLGPYLAVGRGLKGDLAIRRGNAAVGVELLSSSLNQLHAARYALVSTAFSIALARGLADLGRITEGLAVLHSTLRAVDEKGDFCYMPELLRLKERLEREARA